MLDRSLKRVMNTGKVINFQILDIQLLSLKRVMNTGKVINFQILDIQLLNGNLISIQMLEQVQTTVLHLHPQNLHRQLPQVAPSLLLTKTSANNQNYFNLMN